MARSSDTSQASALSRMLRREGWNPCPSDHPLRFVAGLRVARGTLGMGASVLLQNPSERRLRSAAADMADDLRAHGYAFEQGEIKNDGHGDWTCRFACVKKAVKGAEK